jgi:hypothetical protein
MIRVLVFLAALFVPTVALAQAPPVMEMCNSGNPAPNQWVPCSTQYPLPVTGSAPYSYTNLTPSQNALGVANATALTVPTGATYAVVCVEGAGVRWTWDGTTTPTANVGSPVASGSCLAFSGASILAALKFIQQSATATIDVEYAK